ncbi:MAG: hypothetical protein P1V18_00695 [Candidatus Gracilibacteria bacterium]|nr:hypothetical protein [Candidatus Gracilibacteria bacterium]
MLKQLLQIGSSIKHIPLTGVLGGRLYHTVFVTNGNKYTPFLIFGDGEHHEIKHAKKDPYSFVFIDEKKLIFNTGEKLWYNGGLVCGVSHEGVRLVLDQEQVDPQKLLEDLKSILSGYYDFYSEEELFIVCAHILHSYLLGLLGKTFYLLLDGIKGTGKSSLQNLMAMLQMNGTFCGKSSVASIVRKVNSLMANINLDELDKIDPKDIHVLVGVMNSGLYRNGTYEITDMNSKQSEGQIKVYHTFSTKTFSTNKALFHDSFMSRCVVIHTIKNRKPIEDIHSRSEEVDEKFQNIRDRIFACCLMNAEKFSKAIKERQQALSKSGLFGRRSDIFSIIGGVLDVMGADTESVLSYLAEKDEMQTEDNEEKDRLYHLLKYFTEQIEQGVELISVTNQQLTEYLRESLGLDEYDKYAPTSSSVGSLLTRSKIISSKKEKKRDSTGNNGGKGRYYYEIKTEKIKDIIRRNEYADLKERISSNDITTSPDTAGLTMESVSEVFSEPSTKDQKPFTDKQ